MNKRVSVILPVYNVQPDFIKEAIDSVFNQTYKDIELIIVNDGSTNENTLAFLKNIDTSKIKLVNQKNKGLGGARNTGIDNATGYYIGFLDADDWIDNNYYETLVNLCEENSADIACGTLCRVEKNNQFDLDKFENVVVSEFVEKMKFVTNGSTCSKLFKKDLFKNIRYIEHKYWEDNPVLVEIFLKSRNVVFSNSVRYYYRENPKSISLEPSKLQKRQIDGLYMLNRIYEIVQHEKVAYQRIAVDAFTFLCQQQTYSNQQDFQEIAKKMLNKDLTEYFKTGILYSPLEKVFSIKNSKNKKHKVLTILGVKIKFKRKKHASE